MERLGLVFKRFALGAFGLLWFLFAACQEEEIQRIDYNALKELQTKNQSKLVFLDVRTEDEFQRGHVDAAINVPLNELAKRIAELDKDWLIVIYCRSGNRSKKAYQILKESGFKKIYDFGGIADWPEPLQIGKP